MSTDENRQLRPSERPVERVELPPGPDRDLRDVIYQLYADADCPRLDDLAGAIAADDSLPGSPKKDLIGKVISGATRASQRDTISIAVALARARDDVSALTATIRRVWVAAQTGPAPAETTVRPPIVRLGEPISGCDPVALEVHRAIDVPGAAGRTAGDLPPYVTRAHDRRLRTIAEQVLAGDSRMITLVGGSSTGKTRACWELAQHLEQQQPGRWRLWHPYDPTRPEAAAAAVDQAGPHTIVWLNEAQHYLKASQQRLGERIAAGLRTLLGDRARAPVLVLATLWLNHWNDLTTPPTASHDDDPYAQARYLLPGTEIKVEDAFTTGELAGLAASDDPRLRQAAAHAEDGRITQYLAGGPELERRYKMAEPAARVIIEVAMDARRLGHPLAIPLALLEQAAPYYMHDDEWHCHGEHWLEQALADTTRPCKGARGPLTRLRPRPGDPASSGGPVYRLADYLEQIGAGQRAGIYPPPGFWDAAALVIRTPATLRSLGGEAEIRGRYRHAATLYRAAADHGSTGALRDLAGLRRLAGDLDGAVALYREAADHGSIDALHDLAWLRQQAGDVDGAAALYREAADHDSTDGTSTSWTIFIALAAPGDRARLREQAGDVDRAAALAHTAAGHGDTSVLDSAREAAGDLDGAVSLARKAASDGDTSVLRALARSRDAADDVDGAVALYREAADHGSIDALRDLAQLADDLDGAAALYREAADHGSIDALLDLARLRQQAGDVDGAAALYREAADHDSTDALHDLARLRQQAGDVDGAAALYREAADHGSTGALRTLAWLREQAGDLDAVAALYREAANRCLPGGLIGLAELREQAGDPGGAANIRRFGLNGDGSPAEPWTV